MSCHEWENGTITLPTGYAPKLRAVLNAAANEHISRLTSETSQLWNHLKKIPVAKRHDSLRFSDAFLNVSDEAWFLIDQSRYADGKFVPKLAKPSASRIKASVVSRQTPWDDPQGKKLTVFTIGTSATITLDGNKVIWDVPENNHACDYARGHSIAQALFGFLERVEWTSRSGGTITGNNEYNRDTYEGGGGANFVVQEYSRKAMIARRAMSRHSRYGWR